jgi:hypothetical protein
VLISAVCAVDAYMLNAGVWSKLVGERVVLKPNRNIIEISQCLQC